MEKRILIFLLVFVLTGCSKQNDGRVKITYQTMETLPEQRKALAQLVAEFEKEYPYIHVDVLTSTTSFQKLSIQIAGGNAPDVFYYVNDRLPGLAKKGALLDLTPFASEVDMSLYFTQAVESCKIEGRYYLFPFHFSTDVLFYNKDLFNKEGIDYPNNKWTWDDFLKTAQILTKRENRRIIQYGTLQPRPLLLIKSFGGECFNKDLTKCTLNSAESRKALEFIIDLDKRYNAAPSAVTIKDMEQMDGVDMFSMGKVGMFLGRTFMLSEFRKLKSFKWDIAPVPIGEKSYSRLAVGGNCISINTKHPKEAWEFVKFFSGKQGSYICGTSGNCVPALKEAATSLKFLFPPPENARLFVTSIEDAESDNPGLVIWEEFYQRVVQENIDKILCGLVTIDSGLQEIEKEGNEILRNS